jgi:hypothetical protein
MKMQFQSWNLDLGNVPGRQWEESRTRSASYQYTVYTRELERELDAEPEENALTAAATPQVGWTR